MSTVSSTTVNPVGNPNKDCFHDWKDDETIVATFADGAWCTNYGRLYDESSNTTTPRRATMLDHNTISYIKAIYSAGMTSAHGCDAVHRRIIHTVIRVYYNNVQRKELERILAEETETEKVMSTAYACLSASMSSNNPEVEQAVDSAINTLKYSLAVLQHHNKMLNDEIAALI